MNVFPSRYRTILFRALLTAALAPVFAFYPLSFLFQRDIFLVVAVFSLTFMLINLSWYRWMWCIYAFAASIPLFTAP